MKSDSGSPSTSSNSNGGKKSSVDKAGRNRNGGLTSTPRHHVIEMVNEIREDLAPIFSDFQKLMGKKLN